MHNASDSDARVRGPDSNASTRRKIRYLGTCQLPYPSGETTPVINSRSLPRSFPVDLVWAKGHTNAALKGKDVAFIAFDI